MIGIDRTTGRTLSAFDQFVSRVAQVMTTPLGAREHRPAFGSRVPETLARNMGDDLLLLVQAHAVEAFYNPVNGIDDFEPSEVVASRDTNGVRLRFAGKWRYGDATFEVSL